MFNTQHRFSLLVFTVVVLALPLYGAARSDRYALILEDQPTAKIVRPGVARNSLEVLSKRRQIRQKQLTLRKQLESTGFHVTGSVDTLLNAVFVIAAPGDAAALKALPGVKAVFPLHRRHLNLNAAANLLDAPAAWNLLGGTGNAGAGVKIAMLDTGIDQTHAAFQDSTLPMPAGYPICDTTANCAYTSNKVIVARSYVSQLADAGNSVTSFPDDTSPRDRVGHGTATAMCAGGNTNSGPAATITGLAPHAYLGNYKIFGSPEINDFSTDDVIISALNDAFDDQMDIASLSVGGLAFSAPLDTGSFCQAEFGIQTCDPLAVTVENAVLGGMLVVVAAGNDGADGYNNGPATYTTISSPADAPDAIAAAATGNSHEAVQTVQITGPSVPSGLSSIPAAEDDGPRSGVLTAPLMDAQNVGDVYGCSAYPANSMQGGISLIERGPGSTGTACTFAIKLENAQNAGAVGVIFYDNGQETGLINPSVTSGGSSIPSFFISTGNGQNLKSYVDAASGVTANLNSAVSGFIDPGDTNQVTSFSSRGPALGGGLKPDVTAPGENIYMATQHYDPLGEMYDTSGYTSQSGTSFSTPMIAGIAALVHQQHPNFTTTQVKSAIVNTATNDTSDPWIGSSGQSPSGVLSVGGGKAEASNAVKTNVTAEPSTLGFGILTGSVAASQTLTVTNFSSGSLTLTFGVTRTTADAATQITLSPATLTLAAGQAGSVAVTLAGTKPAAGIYEGAITITGGAQALHVPYLYLVGDGVPYELIVITGDQEIGTVSQDVPGGAAVEVIDQYGVPVAGLPVSWTAPDGDGSSVSNADSQTDRYGQAYATTTLGNTANADYRFTLNITGFTTFTFDDQARAMAIINGGGAVNAASNALGNGIAPGSYISLYGTNLADAALGASYVPLPIAINYTSVGFDANNVSVPGALSYVGDTQINVQVPWELAGQSSVDIKVNTDYLLGRLLSNVPVTTYSPAMFVVNGVPAAVNVSSGTIVSASNAATRGQYISLYCNGLGPVTNQPVTGAVALANPLSWTAVPPNVTIGGQTATVQFYGLAPNYVGLYQLNVQVPTGISAGSQPVALSINGVAAPTVNIPVQ